MRKLMMLGGLACALCTPASAQGGFGIVGGLVSANVSFEGDDEFDFGSRTGFALGISMNRPFANGLEFAPELLYVQKGAKAEQSGDSYAVKLGYVEAPILFRMVFGDGSARPFVLGGPVVGFNVGCKVTFTSSGDSGSEDCDDDDIESVDYGIMFGGGIMMQRLSLSIRYDLGLANVNASEGGGEQKNRALMLLAGYSF